MTITLFLRLRLDVFAICVSPINSTGYSIDIAWFGCIDSLIGTQRGGGAVTAGNMAKLRFRRVVALSCPSWLGHFETVFFLSYKYFESVL